MVLSALMMMIAYFLSSTADFMLAARLLDDNAMAAVNLVTPIFFVIAFLSAMTGTGTSYMYSFEIGAFRHEKANKLVGQRAILAVTSSILLTLILFWGQDVFFSLFDVTGEIENFAREYYSLFFLSVAINPVYFLMFVIIFADGGGKHGVIANFLNLFVNVVSSIILGMKFGIAGIAFGRFLGYLSAILVFAKWIFFDSQTLKPILYISLSETIKIMKYSFVNASVYLYIGFGNIILNTFFKKLKPHGWQVLPKRWIVERTFAWLNHSHRLSKDYELTAASAETLIKISHIHTLLKRL